MICKGFKETTINFLVKIWRFVSYFVTISEWQLAYNDLITWQLTQWHSCESSGFHSLIPSPFTSTLKSNQRSLKSESDSQGVIIMSSQRPVSQKICWRNIQHQYRLRSGAKHKSQKKREREGVDISWEHKPTDEQAASRAGVDGCLLVGLALLPNSCFLLQCSCQAFALQTSVEDNFGKD